MTLLMKTVGFVRKAERQAKWAFRQRALSWHLLSYIINFQCCLVSYGHAWIRFQSKAFYDMNIKTIQIDWYKIARMYYYTPCTSLSYPVRIPSSSYHCHTQDHMILLILIIYLVHHQSFVLFSNYKIRWEDFIDPEEMLFGHIVWQTGRVLHINWTV